MSLILGLLSLKRRCLLVALGLLLVAGMGWGVWLLKPRPMQFQSPAEFETFARQHGLLVHSGRTNPQIMWDNFFVLDHPVDAQELGRLTRVDCGLSPAWKGIVWVAQSQPEQNQPWSQLSPGIIGGHWRLWSKVLAAGDPELLDRLEELYFQH